jgi:hypothetical protein
MSALLQTALKTDLGCIFQSPGEAITHHSNGLPFTAAGALAVAYDGVVAHYHQGLPFTAAGRLAIQGAAPVRFSTGCAGFVDPLGNLSGNVLAEIPDHYVHGVGYRASGACAVDTTAPT